MGRISASRQKIRIKPCWIITREFRYRDELNIIIGTLTVLIAGHRHSIKYGATFSHACEILVCLRTNKHEMKAFKPLADEVRYKHKHLVR